MSGHRVTLRYGRGDLTVHLPADCEPHVLRTPRLPVLADPVETLRRALADPVDCPPLSHTARGCRSACILICDITRPVPNGTVLPVLIRTLLGAGVPADGITVLVATGLHRPNRGDELAELVGDPAILDQVRVVNHHARRHRDHVDLGTTDRGTPILLDRRFVEADVKLVVGLVEPHFMAGWSGGRKVIVPGVCHEDTICRFHAADFMEHPRARRCTLDDNPVHAEQLAIVRRLQQLNGEVSAVNVALDEARRVVRVDYGALEAGHEATVRFLGERATVSVAYLFETVITSAGGYPLDATYYQAVKGMEAAAAILAPGGRIFVASQCAAGLGSAEYRAAQHGLCQLGERAFQHHLRQRARARIDEWQTQMQLRATAVGSVRLVTDGLGRSERSLTGIPVEPDLDAAVGHWLSGRADRRVAVIPDGPYVAMEVTSS